MSSICRHTFAAFACLATLAFVRPVYAAPGDVLFSDDFNDGSIAPWTRSVNSRSNVSNAGGFASSGFGAFTRRGPVTVTGPTFNAAVPGAQLSLWVRRGSDAFSEDTDANEDFVIEYRRADNTWVTLASYLGAGTNGQIFTDSFVLPADALHGSLALRVRQTAGSGTDFDYWHFDDVVVTEIAPAPPVVVGSCDEFESGLTNWSINTGSGVAGINTNTFSSPNNALFLNGGTVDVTSNVIDTSAPDFTNLTLWIRRGADAFSENPDGGEDFQVQYLDDTNTWQTLETFPGGGSPGQIFTRSYNLPANGRHAGFRVRFRQLGGSGTIYDFWHVDDVCFEQVLLPTLQVTKVAQTISDPVNGTVNPMSIPGAVVRYTVTVTNVGPGTVDADSLRLTDPLPGDVELFIDDAGGDPIVFSDGSTPSGLSFSYPGNVQFSDQPGGTTYGYTPVDPGDGFDPAITGFELAPSGTMNAASGGNNPSFTFTFLVRLR